MPFSFTELVCLLHCFLKMRKSEMEWGFSYLEPDWKLFKIVDLDSLYSVSCSYSKFGFAGILFLWSPPIRNLSYKIDRNEGSLKWKNQNGNADIYGYFLNSEADSGSIESEICIFWFCRFKIYFFFWISLYSYLQSITLLSKRVQIMWLLVLGNFLYQISQTLWLENIWS